jgi:hypothetical protein
VVGTFEGAQEDIEALLVGKRLSCAAAAAARS